MDNKNIVKVNFKPPENTVQHKCDAVRDGDWIIFRCSKCQKYERKLNWRTGEMKIKNDSQHIYHTGEYFPVEYEEVYKNLN